MADGRELRPAGVRPLTIEQERTLASLIDECWSDDAGLDVDRLGHAIERWAFDEKLVYLPASPELRRAGCVFVPTTPWGNITPVYVAGVGTAIAPAPPAERKPSLRELGAQRIDEAAA